MPNKNRSQLLTWIGLGVAVAITIAAALYFTGNDRHATPVTTGVGPGKPVPELTGKALDGSTVTLSSLKGKPVWITFGATWCAPCRAEAPDMQAAYEAHKGKGLQLVAIYMSEKDEAVQNYVNTLKLTYTHIPDPKSQYSASFGATSIPVHFFVDAEGIVRLRKEGGMSRAAMDVALEGIGA